MKKIRLLAFTAAIICVAAPAFAQGIYLDLGGDGPRRYRDDGRRDRDYDRPRYRDRDRVGTVIVEAGRAAAADTIGLGDIRPSTAAKTAGPCKTVSASRTAATEQKFGRQSCPRRRTKPADFFVLVLLTPG